MKKKKATSLHIWYQLLFSSNVERLEELPSLDKHEKVCTLSCTYHSNHVSHPILVHEKQILNLNLLLFLVKPYHWHTWDCLTEPSDTRKVSTFLILFVHRAVSVLSVWFYHRHCWQSFWAPNVHVPLIVPELSGANSGKRHKRPCLIVSRCVRTCAMSSSSLVHQCPYWHVQGYTDTVNVVLTRSATLNDPFNFALTLSTLYREVQLCIDVFTSLLTRSCIDWHFHLHLDMLSSILSH